MSENTVSVKHAALNLIKFYFGKPCNVLTIAVLNFLFFSGFIIKHVRYINIHSTYVLICVIVSRDIQDISSNEAFQ